jgi:hypothetical protein
MLSQRGYAWLIGGLIGVYAGELLVKFFEWADDNARWRYDRTAERLDSIERRIPRPKPSPAPPPERELGSGD